MELPAVTFIMAARNAISTIGDALDSIAAQDYAGQMRTIVVDDASSDGTGSLAETYSGVKVLRNDRQLGRSLSRNRALEIVDTPIVAIHDADDISRSSRLSACVPLLAADTAVVVGSQLEWTDPGVGPYSMGHWPESSEECSAKASRGRMPVAHPTMIASTMLLRSVGGYDSKFPVGEDLDLILRIVRDYPQTLFMNSPYTGVEYHRPRVDPVKYAISSAYWREKVMSKNGFSRAEIGGPWWLQAGISVAKQRIRPRATLNAEKFPRNDV